MPVTIPLERLVNELLELYDETFDRVHGYYLNRGTSLFETLATISAETASIPVSADCATLAAQVAHVRFYLDVLADSLEGTPEEGVDWGAIWRDVQAVTPDEWEASQRQLRASYERVLRLVKNPATWESEDTIADALAILAHTAYHLGEIRQALCTVKPT